MENNNNSSNSSVCTKIRQAFASSSGLRAIKRILSLNQEHKHATNGSNSPPKANSIQTKPHHKAQTETSSDAVPIKFDYSTPNGNSSAVSSVAKDASTHVGNSERATKVSAKSELPQPQHVPKKVVAQNGNQHGKELVDIITSKEELIELDDLFNSYIPRTKIRRNKESVDNYSFKGIIEGISKREFIERAKKEPDVVNNANIHRGKTRRAQKVDQNHNNGWK